MTREEVIEKVNEFLIEEFEVEPGQITPEANLHETLELDSLDYVDLVVVIESTFGFKLTAEDFKEISSFDTLYDNIYGKLVTV